MSAILVGNSGTWNSPPAVARQGGISRTTWFVVAMSVLVVLASIVPFSDSWTLSASEHYQHVDALEGYASEGSMARKIVIGSLGLLGLLGCIWPGRKLTRIDLTLAVLGVGYIAWCGTTCLWADDPGIAFRRFVALVAEALAALAIVKHVPLRQFVWMALACSLAWLGLGLVAEMSLGTLRPWEPGYRFAGVFHPNRMSVICSILMMASLYLARDIAARRRLLLSLAAVAFGFLLLTGSRTAVISVLGAMAVAWAMSTPMHRVGIWLLSLGWIGLAAAIVAGGLLVGAGENALTLGRTDSELSSLTGRTPLWEELSRYAAERPLAGYGYNAFWSVDRMRDVGETQDWSPNAAHSAYLDLLLSVGLVGFVLCLLPMFIAMVRANRLEKRLPGAGYGFITLLLLLSFIGGLTETTIGVTWLLSLFGICAVAYVAIQAPDVAIPAPQRERRKLGPARLKRIDNFTGTQST